VTSPSRQPASWAPELPARAIQLAKAIRQIGPDIIHAHQDGTCSIAILAKLLARTNAPVIAHTHDRPQFPGTISMYWVHRLLLRAADLVLCCSEYVRDAHTTHYHINPSRAATFYLGTDLRSFDNAPSPAIARRDIQLANDVTVIGFLGRMVKQHKGLDILLRSARLLIDRGLSFVVLIVGSGPETLLE